MERVLTIGVYGWDADAWLAALRRAGCDLVVDIRARRAVRGHEYAFANRKRLEAALATAGIRYLYLPELAPTRAMREAQASDDRRTGIRRRARTVLGQTFVDAYEQGVVEQVDWEDVAKRVDGVAPALLCVERLPSACHRSIAASRLAAAAGVPVEDVIPWSRS